MNATLAPCTCKNFADATTGETLACTATTRRNFAPGHDARLKGFLIRVGRAGHLVVVTNEPGQLTPAAAAQRFGFGQMVRDGIARVAPVRKAKAQAVPAKVTAKVGRWSYEGTVTAGGKIFTYTDRKGAQLMAEKFTIVG